LSGQAGEECLKVRPFALLTFFLDQCNGANECGPIEIVESSAQSTEFLPCAPQLGAIRPGLGSWPRAKPNATD
jgi:hypothetical protein